MARSTASRAAKSIEVDSLAVLLPEGITAENGSWQARKRSDFRVVVLEAVISCLAEHGYAQTTTELIAARAKVSRGTMLHRFPTRQALIAAATDYAFFRRMQNFIAAVGALTEEERVNQNLGIFASWKQFFTREYRAYLELHIAARTDPELRETFLPRAKLYDQIWRRETLRAFPEWGKDKAMHDRACEFVRSTIEGLALNSDIWDNEEHQAIILQFVADTARAIRDKKLKFPKKAKVKSTRPAAE